MATRIGFLLLTTMLAGGLVLAIQGCSGEEQVTSTECGPAGNIIGKECLWYILDAGVDAPADASEDGPSVKPQSGACDRCVPGPSADDALFWGEEPLILWMGPPNELPACPSDIAPDKKFTGYADLKAPPAICDECKCKPSTGDCSLSTAEVSIRSAKCGDMAPTSIPFNGPPGWDGSCSTVGAVAAGAQCPPGSGVLCAQSIYASVLPGPTNESCEPYAEVVDPPKFWKETEWGTMGRACSANTPQATCDDDKKYCLRELSVPWLHCVSRKGVHTTCPGNFNNSRFVLYSNQLLDTRECSPCECGAPAGSGCAATLRVYEDGVCGNEISASMIGSMGDNCTNVIPKGAALGSDEITNVTYLEGTCLPSGGEPYGSAEVDPDSAVTFCCLGLFGD